MFKFKPKFLRINFGLKAMLLYYPRRFFTAVGLYLFKLELNEAEKHMKRKKLWKD